MVFNLACQHRYGQSPTSPTMWTTDHRLRRGDKAITARRGTLVPPLCCIWHCHSVLGRDSIPGMTEPMMKDSWWAMWHRGGRLEQLNTAECRRLLAATSIGRLGYQMDRGPRIVPVNYALAGETIVIRTAPNTEIARFAPGQTVAFETDQVDEFLQTGWSVLAVGKLNLVSEESLRMLATQQMPDPWAEGSRSVFLQLGTDELTGRRVHQA